MKFSNPITFLLLLYLSLSSYRIYAQEEPKRPGVSGLSGITKNVIIGYAYADFVYTPHDEIKTNFNRVGFSPTMIWKLGEHLFFESQVEFFTDSNIIVTQVEYAKLSYLINPYMTLGMGKILTPFGMYTERFEAPFIERLPNAPLGFRHQEEAPNIGPVGSEMGLDIRGGFHVGDGKMNYVVFVTNGPRLNEGLVEHELGGALDYENFSDNNSNKAIGGRLGILPLSNSSLEFGFSASTATAGDIRNGHKNVSARAGAFDVAYQSAFQSVKSLINIKGQINYLEVDPADYVDESGAIYSFNNTSSIYYIRASLRPAFVKNYFIRHTEFLVRYNGMHLAEGALWGGKSTRLDLGISYWLSLRTGLRIAYEATNSAHHGKEDAILVRFVTGF